MSGGEKMRCSKGMKFLVPLLVLLLVACGGPEEKKLKFFKKGNALYDKRDYVSATLEFKNAIQIDPNYTEAFYMLGMSELRLGDGNKAFRDFSKAIELDPKYLKAHIELGQLFLGSRMFDKAQGEATFILTQDPRNSDGILLQSALHLVEGNRDKARELLEGLLSRGITKEEAYLMLSLVWRRSQDVAKEEHTLLKGISANLRSIPLYIALADFHIRNKRFDDAVADMKKVIYIDPKNLDFHSALAGIYWQGGRTSEASAALKALTADPQKEAGWIKAAAFYTERHQFEEAEKELKAGLQQNPKSYKLRFALGDLYSNTAKADQAVAVLKECLQISNDGKKPEIIETKNALAKIALSRHDLAGAKRYAEEVIEDNPKDTEAIFIRGTAHMLQGNAVNAISDFRMVVTNKPRFAPGHISLAEAHVLNGEPNLAIDTLKSALRSDPKSRDLNRALAAQYAMQKNVAAAEATLLSLLQTNPDDLEVQVALGDLYAGNGNYKKAEALYNEVKGKTPKDTACYVKIAKVNMAQSLWGRAAVELEQALKISPQSNDITALLAHVYLLQKKASAATALAESRISKNSKDAFAFNLLGEIQRIQGNFPKAEENFRKSLSIAPLWPLPQDNLVSLYFLQGRKNDAINWLETVIKTYPDNYNSYMSLAQLYVKTRDDKKAVETYERVLARKPDLWVAANDLAFFLADSGGDLNKAQGLVQRALVQRPHDPTLLDTVGWIAFKKGDFNKAIEYLEGAKTRSTDTPIFNYHLGASYAKAGRADQAKVYLRKAVSSGPDFMGKQEAEKMLRTL